MYLLGGILSTPRAYCNAKATTARDRGVTASASCVTVGASSGVVMTQFKRSNRILCEVVYIDPLEPETGAAWLDVVAD